MAYFQSQTSLISILSCEHGRLRREQRDIDKRDLKRALKYGSRERCWGQRWKVEYDGLIFITDDSMRREITAFPSPLAFAPIEDDAQTAHYKACHLLQEKPELCVSHTVLVVDNSGSMMTHDIRLHRDRQTAAYTETALEFVAEQIFSGTANNSDVVSLIEFAGEARVIFTRQPIGWVLYNKLLSRRDERTFKSREGAKTHDLVWCDSNYLPALELAGKLLRTNNHEGCALSLFFLSDGAPSDSRALGLTPTAAQRRMCLEVEQLALEFDNRLNVTMVGFGASYSDFSALKSMVETVKTAPGGSRAEFIYCNKMSNAIGGAVTSLVTSLTATRTALMEGQTMQGYTKRQIATEGTKQSSDWKYHQILKHFVFDPRTKNFLQDYGLPPGSISTSNESEAMRRKWSPPPYLAINTKSCGKGVERVAYRCQLSDDKSADKFVLGTMVAKETNLVERIEEHVDFHLGFLETQSLAAHLAEEFNRRLIALPHYSPATTPKISFLECSVLLLKDSSWRPPGRGVLVEKKLDTERFGWCKWNNNAGAVDGRIAHVPLDVDHELAKLDGILDMGLGAIAEGEDSEDDDESDEESFHADFEIAAAAPIRNTLKPSDYLQAFTHFTYLYTNKKVMVCDLQGVFNTDLVPPTFELSDPAIHYASKRREMVFGRTDKGKKGMQLFFNTHHCTTICKLMQLSKKNKHWRKHWHEDSDGSGR